MNRPEYLANLRRIIRTPATPEIARAAQLAANRLERRAASPLSIEQGKTLASAQFVKLAARRSELMRGWNKLNPLERVEVEILCGKLPQRTPAAADTRGWIDFVGSINDTLRGLQTLKK